MCSTKCPTMTSLMTCLLSGVLLNTHLHVPLTLSHSQMITRYVRKTTRRAPLIGVLNAARDQVRCGVSVRKAAEDYGLQFMTLWRHCHADGEDGHRTFGYVKKTVLSPEMERKLGEYLQTASQLNYGLTPRETRQLAYKFAVANKLRVPPSWDRKSEAGIDWFLGFMKRQSYLSTRKPQATSLARASAFNKVTVNRFFDLLGQVYDKHKFEPKDVWNMDETGVTTCHTPQKVIATKGARRQASEWCNVCRTWYSGDRGRGGQRCRELHASSLRVPSGEVP